MEKLLDSLQYCNDYIKVYNGKSIISKTKFYNLKYCIMDYLLRNWKTLGITIDKCIIQPSKDDQSIVEISISYKNKTYIFHQLFENIQWALICSEVFTKCIDDVYERRELNIENNYQAFEKGIKYIKHYIWNHYNDILSRSTLFIEKPIQYINTVSFVNNQVKIEYSCNGSYLQNSSVVSLKYKGELVKKALLTSIRKKLLNYINEYSATK